MSKMRLIGGILLLLFVQIVSSGCSDNDSNPTQPEPRVVLVSYETASDIHPTSVSSISWNSQSFTLEESAKVDSLGVQVLSISNNPGQLVVSLHPDTPNGPGHELAAWATPQSGTGWLVGALASSVPVEAETTYWIIARSTEDSGSFELEHDNAGTYPGGFNAYSENVGVVWFHRVETDLIFRVIGRW